MSASTGHAPDFLIAGAPKAATTSLYETLAKHPQIFFPSIKEPHFFAQDLPSRHEVETQQLYDGLFASAPEGSVRGDGSVCSAVSDHALERTIERSPKVKFIFVARNPLDLLVSFHNEMLKGLRDPRTDVKEAWDYQLLHPAADRSQSYKDICSCGAQVQKIQKIAPEKQTLVLFYDDIVADPRSVFLQIVNYLGVEDDGTEAFVHANSRALFTNPLVAKIMIAQIGSPGVRKFRAKYKERLNKMGIRPYQWLSKMFLRPVPKVELSPEFQAQLLEYFEADIALLESCTGRDLSRWRGAEKPVADPAVQMR